MVLLSSNRLEDVPKDAVILTEGEALRLQWEEVDEYRGEQKLWSLRHGASLLGCLSAATGIYINHHYRSRLRLGKYGAFSTYLPIVVLPALVTTAYHKTFIQSAIILRQEPCPLCVQIRASFFQTCCGLVYPAALAPVASYMFAVRQFTYRLPPFSKPKELFAVYRKMTKPLSMFFSIALAIHVITAMALTQREILEFHGLEQETLTKTNLG
ncbi:Complex I assembly factor TMEM126B, mitochondrial [Pseudolycoriella hygida]|uniref:Complex I assembly factor TMEM126B, mitochondrial n=1 Tax=Pseudolycoriella hygida TaxID=35572 RepID=A0A9Q0MU11_9DIPT|nr:Complex I assembly factor TMEM126B, mitochondrial [Pseudolycoriella hygida]